MERNIFAGLRSRLVETAHGRVLDVGAGTGAKLRAQDAGTARWQGRRNPIWTVIASGCHLDRDTLREIGAAGFVVETADVKLETALPFPLRPRLLAVARNESSALRA